MKQDRNPSGGSCPVSFPGCSVRALKRLRSCICFGMQERPITRSLFGSGLFRKKSASEIPGLFQALPVLQGPFFFFRGFQLFQHFVHRDGMPVPEFEPSVAFTPGTASMISAGPDKPFGSPIGFSFLFSGLNCFIQSHRMDSLRFCEPACLKHRLTGWIAETPGFPGKERTASAEGTGGTTSGARDCCFCFLKTSPAGACFRDPHSGQEHPACQKPAVHGPSFWFFTFSSGMIPGLSAACVTAVP